MNVVEEREAAIAGLYAARDFLRDNPTATDENRKQFETLYSKAARHLVNATQMLGVDPPRVTATEPQAAVDQLIAWAAGPAGAGGGRNGLGLPFGVPGTGIGSVDGGSWRLAAGVVTSFLERGIGFGAELVTSGNVPVAVPVRREIVAEPRAARFLADIVPQEEAGAGRFSYFKQTLRDHNAAIVPRGARKPVSLYTLEKVADEVEVLAHITEPVHRFDLADAESLRTFLDAELEHGLRKALDDEIVNGPGTGARFNGILNQAATEAWAGSQLATTRSAITTLEETDTMPSHFAMSPQTWASIEAEAAADFAALPAMSPLDATARRLHGVGVVVTNALADGVAILGDFRYAVLYRTGPLMVDWSDAKYRTAAEMGDGNPGTDWERNMLAFRAEMRAMLAILRPAAFLELDLTAA